MINTKIQDRADKNKDFRFHIQLNFFSTDKESSIGHVRVQMKSPRNDGLRVSVINWGESTTMCSDKIRYLDTVSSGNETIELTLISDISGNLWIWLNNLETPLTCDAKAAGFLNEAHSVIVQWMGLRHGNKLFDQNNLFKVQYSIGEKPGE